MYDEYREAGKISKIVKKEVRPMLKDGAKVLDIAEFVEGKIQRLGGELAFPCNISINEIAAHYSPPIHDETTLGHGDYVTVDLGAHINGYIADTAFTVRIGEEKDDIIKASEEALKNAISMIKAGVNTADIGVRVEETIKEYGFKPIENLNGHKLAQNKLHEGVTVPNIAIEEGYTLKDGDVFAIEPFATDGAGRAINQSKVFIFKYLGDRPIRLKIARRVLRDIRKNYPNLPFAERWLSKRIRGGKLEFALKLLMKKNIIYSFNVLEDEKKGSVTQSEHTVIVKKDGCEVTT
ncbi:MAG: type II methionyl aminopeptidase [Euryarchaeota archaeon]|nr:type II methionyl aminopeptidase [Euryarchaeota archaeon]